MLIIISGILLYRRSLCQGSTVFVSFKKLKMYFVAVILPLNIDALARLKERIKQQKEQASRLSPTDSFPGKAFLSGRVESVVLPLPVKM